MNQFIRQPADRLRAIYDEAEGRRGLRAQALEKDFWVCWTLRELFALPPWAGHLTFKGGTSLSKAWRLIERFSEDIDVVIDREFLGFGGATLSKKKQKKLKTECSRRIQGEMKPALTQRIAELLPAGSIWSLESTPPEEDADQQTLLFKYPSVFAVPAEYLRPLVKIEMGARSQTEPAADAAIQSYVAEIIPGAVSEHTFPVRTVAARRTFWEKVMLLHEETYRPDPPAGASVRKPALARHYYDVFRLIEGGIADEAVADAGLFDQVREHREAFFDYGWMDYTTIRRGTMRVLPLDRQLDAWRRDYGAMRGEMFLGAPPPFDTILKVVGDFARYFNSG